MYLKLKKKNNNILLYILNIFLYLTVSITNGKTTEYHIYNDNLNELNTINYNQNNDIIIYFPEKDYNLSLIDSFSFNINNNINYNITFAHNIKSKIKTTFNYKNYNYGKIKININLQANTGKKVIIKFVNIRFTNFTTNDPDVFLISSYSDNDNYQLIFENCSFENIPYNVYHSKYNCNKVTQDQPQVIFSGCSFLYVYIIKIFVMYTKYI